MKKQIEKVNIFIATFAILIIGGSVFSIATKYSPGQTLNPSCLPGEVNCTVDIPECISETVSIGWKYWTWNNVDNSHYWYGYGNNFRNCEIVQYFQPGENIQNTEVMKILIKVLGPDRTLWDNNSQHGKFLRDFDINPSYPVNNIYYGSWSTTKYGPSTLYRCQVDPGAGIETKVRL